MCMASDHPVVDVLIKSSIMCSGFRVWGRRWYTAHRPRALVPTPLPKCACHTPHEASLETGQPMCRMQGVRANSVLVALRFGSVWLVRMTRGS
jgi:hypothetical protein